MRARAPADEYLVEFVWMPLMSVARANPERAIQLVQDLGLDILHDVVANWHNLEALRAAIEAEEEAFVRKQKPVAAWKRRLLVRKKRPLVAARSRRRPATAKRRLPALGLLLRRPPRPSVPRGHFSTSLVHPLSFHPCW
ncbi:hypothetical protein FOMPIDRAFT_91424 [Fomitopsis schrenkii]|uniref:Uncharacterized protein n=1 Tax=Fomitopsis schrenkii TaxID=2126942 RepID=S8DZT0_FOMSC|nr:hypothetical protein FOMPIDRAFT_91424 [Fomitopsis schrenkii]